MPNPKEIDIFVEDNAHELFLGSLVARLASEAGVECKLNFRVARGGHPRVIQEIHLLRRSFECEVIGLPRLLVCGIDGNCKGSTKRQREVETALGSQLAQIAVAACPDPHLERWLFADMNCFERIVGARPRVPQRKCQRDYYKGLLATAVRRGGNPVLLGGLEFAQQIAREMDLYIGGQDDRSLGSFVSDLRHALRRLAGG